MQYLRKFNESQKEQEIKIFCEEHLVDLLDKGYYIQVNQTYRLDKSLYGIYLRHHDNFEWNDIKDHIIIFLQALEDAYDISVNRTNPNNIFFLLNLPEGDNRLGLPLFKTMIRNWFSKPSARISTNLKEIIMDNPNTKLNKENHNIIAMIVRVMT